MPPLGTYTFFYLTSTTVTHARTYARTRIHTYTRTRARSCQTQPRCFELYNIFQMLYSMPESKLDNWF